MNLSGIFRRNSAPATAAAALYRAAVEKARDPAFYRDLGVADTVNGRFDMLVVHIMLVLRRLRGAGAAAEDVSEALLALMFKDMDRSLRELGVGDMGVGKQVKRMAKAFYGRAAAYEAGLDGAPEQLAQALTENLYRHDAGTRDALAAMSSYIKRMDVHLGEQRPEDLIQGRVQFLLSVMP